ncbi:MAG: HdeD family acid-resistance protein [Thermoanaerobaculia bacterium]
MTTDTLTKQVSKSAAWSIFMGALTAVIGVLMIIYPLATAAASTVFLGAALLAIGAAQAIFAFTSDSVGSFILKLLLGILYGIAGVLLVAFPAAGVLSLTGVLGVMLIAEGIVETFIAIGAPALAGRGWFVFSALSSFLLGVLILAQWPNSSAWAIGTMVGVGVLINGITRVVVSTAVHHEARAMTPKAA